MLQRVSFMPGTSGKWESVQDWPLIAIHTIVLQDGRLLTFGTDENGMQGAQFIYAIYDPATGENQLLSNTTPTDIFCSAAIILPGTDQVLIGGGDARPEGFVNKGVNHVNIFDNGDQTLAPADEGVMNFARWYPTMVSLPTGQVVILGGSDGRPNQINGVPTPEIFTPGEGWRTLPDATDGDVATVSSYPRAWLNGEGEVVYFANGRAGDGTIEVMALDPSGEGSLRQIGELPFNTDWAAPSIMYEAGKVLIQDIDGGLWTMDITGPFAAFERTESLGNDRDWANMTVLADGTVLITGGSENGSSEALSDKTAAIWDPQTGTISYGPDEDQPRLYHSTAVLLADGSVMSMGGGAAGTQNPYLDAQTYKPPYLFDASGNEAVRPVIEAAPASIVPGETFTITVDDASAIDKLTFVKNGATTHGFNMEARMVPLDFTQRDATTLEITMQDNPNLVTAGSWMLFAWNGEGVPSKAPIIAVDPTMPAFDGIGDLRADYLVIDPDTVSLDQIDFDGQIVHSQTLTRIDKDAPGPLYDGGPSDGFAVRFTGEFTVDRPGEYAFYLTSDDGSRLLIDGQQVIDNDRPQAATEEVGLIALDPGTHNLEVLYFDVREQAVIDLDWSGPGFDRTQMMFDGTDDNLLVNGSFERGAVEDAFAATFSSDEVPGWTAPDDRIEIQDGALIGQQASSGGQWLELDTSGGAAVDSVHQDIETEAGQTYELAFSTARRPSTSAETNDVEVFWNGDLIATVRSESTSWKTHVFEVTGTGGTDRLEFREPAAANDGVGGWIDSVTLKAIATPPPLPNTAPAATDDAATTAFGQAVTIEALANDSDADGDPLRIVSVSDPANGTAVIDDNGTPGDTGDDRIVYAPDDGFSGTDAFSYTVGDGTDTATANIAVTVEQEQVDPDPGLNTIEADPDGGYVVGTDGDDRFVGGQGDDTFYARAGDDTVIGGDGYNQIDLDGAAADYGFVRRADGTIIVTHPVYGTDTLTDIDGVWFYGEARWYGIDDLVVPETDQPNIITASDAGGYLRGTAGDDVFVGAGASDVFYGGRGDDVYDGGGGDYNQVDLDGALAEYTLTDNGDGSVTLSHPEYGTDTLTDIDGLWFYGEGRWYSLTDALAGGNSGDPGGGDPGDGGQDPGDPADPAAPITGTDGPDLLTGTAGDDTILAGGGRDVINGTSGNDTIDGQGGDYNQVDYEGALEDYTMTRNDDGTITVSHPQFGTDTLANIQGFWFKGEGRWYSADDATGPQGSGVTRTATDQGGYLTGSEGDDVFIGGAGNDTFYGGKGNDRYEGGADGYDQVDLDGGAADYTFTRNDDGTVTAASAEYGEDVLKDIDGIWFYGDAVWSSVDDLVS